MRRTVSITIKCVALAVLSSCMLAAAPPLELKVEKRGSYVYWFEYTDGMGQRQFTEPQLFKGTSARIDTAGLAAGVKDARLFVMDKASWNTAVADYTAPQAGKPAKPVALASSDFALVRRVTLRIVAEDGKPLARGVVAITDGNGTRMSTVVTPADLGTAVFENVAAGEINVKVRSEGLTKTVDSGIELPLKRSKPAFECDIKVAGDVDTVAVPAGPRAGQKTGQKPAERGANALAAILQFVTGVLLLVVAVAVIAVILRGKGVTARSALKSLGVTMPEDQPAPSAPGPGPAVDSNVCQFCGQPRDAAGRCACTVTPGAAPAPAPGPSAALGPRLIGTQGVFAGHVFEITGGSATIGREQGNTIVLADDSTASRRHASLALSGADFVIRDEGSSNGTFVNGVRVTEQKLSAGDEIQIGASKFRFEC